jgi:diguanylate cyclase (GGDEF)-like protein
MQNTLGLLTLDEACAREFDAQERETTRSRMRTGAKFMLVVLLIFMFADFLRLQDFIRAGLWETPATIFALRVVPLVPIVTGLLLSSERSSKLMTNLALISLATLGLSTLGVLTAYYHSAFPTKIPYSLNGLILVIMAFFFPVGLPYKKSLILAVSLTILSGLTLCFALPATAVGNAYVFLPYLVLTVIIAGVSGLFHDQAKRQQFLLERKLRFSAERDGLTTLYNSSTFKLLSEQAIAAARRSDLTLSLLLIDIDYFKAYNDYYGHPAGDAALAAVGKLIKRSASRSVDLAARLGGEEFAVLLYDTPADEARILAEEIRTQVSKSLRIQHARSSCGSHLSVSIGLAELVPCLTWSGLYQNADNALYAAKIAGRDRVSDPGESASHAATLKAIEKMVTSDSA